MDERKKKKKKLTSSNINTWIVDLYRRKEKNSLFGKYIELK